MYNTTNNQNFQQQRQPVPQQQHAAAAAAAAQQPTNAPEAAAAAAERPSFMVSHGFAKCSIVGLLNKNLGQGIVAGSIVINSKLDPVEVGCCAVQHARMYNVFAYCCVFRFSELGVKKQQEENKNNNNTANVAAAGGGGAVLVPALARSNNNSGGGAAAAVGGGDVKVDAKSRLVNSLRQLKYLGSCRLCVAWHSPEETINEELLTMVNEACLAEQTPLMCAASDREAASIIQSMRNPNGVRDIRQNSFGKADNSANGRMAKMLLHVLGTSLLKEDEAVRVVNAFARERPGSTPAELIEFLGTKSNSKTAVEFMVSFGTVPKPKAERVVSMYCTLFDTTAPATTPGAPAPAIEAGTTVGGNRAREDDEAIQKQYDSVSDIIFAKFAENIESREERRAQQQQQQQSASAAVQQNRRQQHRKQQADPFRPAFDARFNSNNQLQHRVSAASAVASGAMTFEMAARVQTDVEQREREELRKKMTSNLADALSKQFDQDDDDDDVNEFE